MFSIIVPSYEVNDRSASLTAKCLESIELHTKPKHEVVVVRSAQDSRLTYAQSINEGIKRSNGKYLVMLNNDTEVSEGWIESMIECFVLPNCGIATLLGTEHGSLKRDAIIEDFYGPCWMISKRVQDRLGLLDEQFVNSFEDADYWVRAYLAGYKIYRNLNCVIKHKERATCRHIASDSVDSNKNKELFNSKYGELDLPIYKKLRG